MDAREFRIGNYYKPTFSITPEGPAPFAIVDVNDLKAWTAGAVFGKPLPIDDVWLQRLGYSSKGLDDGILKFVNSKLPVYKNSIGIKTPAYYVIIDKDEVLEISYVHQLQNIYFGLTSNELEISKAVHN